MKISRNALCPCGSGKKYKHCHYGRPLPGEEGSDEEIAAEASENMKSALLLGAVGLLVAIGVGFWKDAYTGVVVAAAWALGQGAYLSFRNPPPPNENAGDPAALNFGRSDTKEK